MHREREMDSVQMTATRMPPLRKASRLDIGAKREGSDLSDECHHKVARSGDDPDSTSGLSASKTAGGKLPLGRGGQAVTDAAPQVSNPLVEVRGPAGSLLHKTRSARQEPNPKHPTDGASPPDPGAWREAQHEQMNTQCEATWLTGTEAAVAEDTSVADEACRLPPGQLCNPLVVMCVMALSRQAAVQVQCRHGCLIPPVTVLPGFAILEYRMVGFFPQPFDMPSQLLGM